MRDVGGREVRFLEGFLSGGYGERDAGGEEDGAEFGDGGGAVHVRHGVVNGPDCGTGVNAGVVVNCPYFGHSGRECQWHGMFGKGKKGIR